MDLKVNMLGMKFDNPLMPASGPIVEGLENLEYFNDNQVGGIVTKTISVEGAHVKKPCIVASNHMVHNTELWSELNHEVWVNDILPALHKNLKKPLIISVGYTALDMKVLIPKLDPYADIFEVSTHYNRETLKDLVTTIRSRTDKPIFIKLSPHVEDFIGFVKDVLDYGATGIVAMNSLGPGVVINLEQRAVTIGVEQGKSWVSGPAIKPIALYRVMMIRQAFPEVPIIACGGIESAKDVLEFILAGADMVQMLSTALIKGRNVYDDIIEALPQTLEQYGFTSIEQVRLEQLSLVSKGQGGYPTIDHDKCIACSLCTRICPLMALRQQDFVKVSKERCIRCGLCHSRCPVGAISGVI